MEPPIRKWIQPEHAITALAALTIIAGVALRLVAFGRLPPGLFHDEAFYGLDALGVLDGDIRLYYPANNGREPLFIYVMAGTVALFGRTVVGVRSAALICGLLTLPAMVALGRAWGNRRVGWLSAAVLAVLVWHVHLSRVGFRAISLPLFVSLMLAAGARAYQRRAWRGSILAGVLAGLSLYTYVASRLIPLALVGLLIYGLIWQREWVATRWRYFGLSALAAGLVALPLIGLAVTQPDMVFERVGQVGIWNPEVNQGNPARMLLRNVLASAAMFNWQGDWLPRLNVPERPVFDLATGLLFVGGLALMIWSHRPGGRRVAHGTALALSAIWIGLMVLPNALADHLPHNLRSIGSLPLVALVPALALDSVLTSLHKRRPGAAWAGVAISAAVMGISAGLAARDYFGCRPAGFHLGGFDYVGCYLSDPQTARFFQADITALADEVNHTDGTLYLSRRLWQGYPTLRFLILVPDRATLYEPGRMIDPAALPVTIFAPPGDRLLDIVRAVPPHARIDVQPGVSAWVEDQPVAMAFYNRFRIEAPPVAETAPAACFADGLILRDLTHTVEPGTLVLELAWQAPVEANSDGIAQAQIAIRLVEPGSETQIGQIEATPGTNAFPADQWPLGVMVSHRIEVPIPPGGPSRLAAHLSLIDLASGEPVAIECSRLPVEGYALILDISGDAE